MQSSGMSNPIEGSGQGTAGLVSAPYIGKQPITNLTQRDLNKKRFSTQDDRSQQLKS